MKEWTYIEVDERHRIAVAPSGAYYPEHIDTLRGMDNQYIEGWCKYILSKGSMAKYLTEEQARRFLKTHP